jgi:O-antigen/teichoic acid export membrane protein
VRLASLGRPSRHGLVALALHGVSVLAARLLAPACSFAVTAVIARALGPHALGAFVYAMALVLVAQVAAGGGLSLQLTRELAARPERARALVSHATQFAWLCAGIATLVIGAYAAVGREGDVRLATLLLALSVLPSGEMTVQEGIFLGGRAYHRVTVVAAVENVLKLVLAGGAMLAGGGLTGACAGVAAARWVAFVVGRRLAARTLDAVAPAGPTATADGTREDFRAFVREALPWAALFAVATAYFRVDVIAVETLRGGAAVGHYGAAAAMFAAFVLVPASANAVLYPRLAAAFTAAGDRFRGLARLSIAGVVASAVPPTLIGILLAAPLLVLVFGPDYRESVPALRLLALGIPLHAVNAIGGSVLQAAGRHRAMVRVVLVGLVVQIALDLALVPRYGIEGAALAMLGGSAVGTLVAAIDVWPLVGPSWPSLRREPTGATPAPPATP